MTERLVAGIDVSETRGLDVAVMTAAGELVDVGWVPDVPQLKIWVRSWSPHLSAIAVDAPGDVARQPGGRMVEQQLQSRNVSIFRTPMTKDAADEWMQVGWRIFDVLRDAGLAESREAFAGRPVAIECYPYSGYVALSGALRPTETEPVDWAYRVLRKHGCEFPSTTKDAADAVVAALTARAFIDGNAIAYGAIDEGVIWTPSALPERQVAPPAARSPRAAKGAAAGQGVPCRCKCGKQASAGSRFLQGHDSKLKSRLVKAARAGDEAARAELVELGWEKFI